MTQESGGRTNRERYEALTGRRIVGGGRTEGQEPQTGSNNGMSREGVLDPVQTTEMPVRVSTGFLVQTREESGRASGLSDW